MPTNCWVSYFEKPPFGYAMFHPRAVTSVPKAEAKPKPKSKPEASAPVIPQEEVPENVAPTHQRPFSERIGRDEIKCAVARLVYSRSMYTCRW